MKTTLDNLKTLNTVPTEKLLTELLSPCRSKIRLHGGGENSLNKALLIKLAGNKSTELFL